MNNPSHDQDQDQQHERQSDTEVTDNGDTPEDTADAPQPSAEGAEATSPVNDLEQRYNALSEQHMRLAADFENFRKRVLQEREALLKYGAQSTVEQLLPVLDNLERATGSFTEASDPKMLYQSFAMLSRQLVDSLGASGLKKIPTVGEEFDPNFHEAVEQVPTSEKPENTILEEQQSGYQLHDRVIRPALVKVATTAQGEPQGNDPEAGKDNPFAQVTEQDS